MKNTKSDKMKNKAWHQGYTCAVTALIRAHGMSTIASDVWKLNRLSKEELKALGIDEADIEVLMEHWDELNH